MIKHNIEYENEIKRLISEYPVHFTRMLESKGKHKNRAKDRTYLLNYINTCTPKLNSPFYTTLTKLYWIFNDIEDFPKCANPNCQNKMVNFNVKNLKDGYIKYCSRDCQTHATKDRRRPTLQDFRLQDSKQAQDPFP